jgi:branched-subunit amino acid aminotransferase/4-amino-4-deoxychorismate lyase
LLEIGAGAGAPVVERVLRPEDLYAADEVFISSTNRSMLGVSEVNGRGIAAAPGAVTLQLEKAFGEYVRQYLEARSAASR